MTHAEIAHGPKPAVTPMPTPKAVAFSVVREVVPDWAYVVFWILGSLLAFTLVLTMFQGFNTNKLTQELLKQQP